MGDGQYAKIKYNTIQVLKAANEIYRKLLKQTFILQDTWHLIFAIHKNVDRLVH